MGQCRGTTKQGARCKRQVPDGVEFCTIHEDQAAAGESRGRDTSASGNAAETEIDLTETAKMVLGLVAAGALAYLLSKLKR